MKKWSINILVLTLVSVLAIYSIGFCQSQAKEFSIIINAEFLEVSQNDNIKSKTLFKSSVATINGTEAKISTWNETQPTGIALSVIPLIQDNDTVSLKIKGVINLPDTKKEISSAEIFCKNVESVIIDIPIKETGNDLLIRITPMIEK